MEQETRGYTVAVYALDLVYGGPEEGGWWTQVKNLVGSFESDGRPWTHDEAMAVVEEFRNGEYRDRGDVSSVNYRGGAYAFYVLEPGEEPKPRYPEKIPTHYE